LIEPPFNLVNQANNLIANFFIKSCLMIFPKFGDISKSADTQ
jgi:hypothetical protein